MSDANWDMEYAKARDIRSKIIEFCEKRRLEVPNLEGILRSWKLELILKELENNYSDKNINISNNETFYSDKNINISNNETFYKIMLLL